jgi:hypothetical protein
MSVKYTSGPWKLDERFPGVVLAGDRIQVAAATMNTLLSPEERDANARLIAAAPEMLKALAYYIDVMRADGWADTVLAKGRVAIAKATGGECDA